MSTDRGTTRVREPVTGLTRSPQSSTATTGPCYSYLAPASGTTTVDGKPAALHVLDQQNGSYRHRSLSLEWERRAGQWVIVTGTQELAGENVVRGSWQTSSTSHSPLDCNCASRLPAGC